MHFENKMELGSTQSNEGSSNHVQILSTAVSKSSSRVENQQDSRLCKLHWEVAAAWQLTQERWWTHPGTGQRGHHCLWTKVKLMAEESLGQQDSLTAQGQQDKGQTLPPDSLTLAPFSPQMFPWVWPFLSSPRHCRNIQCQALVAPVFSFHLLQALCLLLDLLIWMPCDRWKSSPRNSPSGDTEATRERFWDFFLI